MTNSLLGEDEFSAIAQRAWETEFLLAQEVQKAGLELLGRGQSTVWSGSDYLGVAILIGLLAKAIKTSRAIILLVQHGLVTDAQGLYRTLLLILAAVRWLCHFPEQANARATRYADIWRAQDIRLRNAMASNPEFRGSLWEEIGRHLEEFIVPLVERYGKAGADKLAKECPWKSDAHLATLTALSAPYDLCYRRASQILHAQDGLEHVDSDPNSGTVTVRDLMDGRWGAELLVMTSKTLLVLLQEVNRSLEGEMEQVLEVASQRADEIWQKRQYPGNL